MNDSLTPALEDYLETILRLSEENGKATISEIAGRLQVAKPSANQAINNLRSEGLINQERYGPVYLTAAGRKKAEQVWQRHLIIRNYLQDILQIPALIAERDACMMEHVISRETLLAMNKSLAKKSLDSKTIIE